MDAPKVKKILELPEWLKELKLQETGIGIYCRVSTTEQRQLRSLSNQITSLIKTVQGWDCLPYLKDVYVDIYTGTSENKRPEFNRMLDDVKAGRIKIVVVKSIQRFGRNTVTVMSAINDIRHAGGYVYFEVENLDTKTTLRWRTWIRRRPLTITLSPSLGARPRRRVTSNPRASSSGFGRA